VGAKMPRDSSEDKNSLAAVAKEIRRSNDAARSSAAQIARRLSVTSVSSNLGLALNGENPKDAQSSTPNGDAVAANSREELQQLAEQLEAQVSLWLEKCDQDAKELGAERERIRKARKDLDELRDALKEGMSRLDEGRQEMAQIQTKFSATQSKITDERRQLAEEWAKLADAQKDFAQERLDKTSAVSAQSIQFQTDLALAEQDRSNLQKQLEQATSEQQEAVTKASKLETELASIVHDCETLQEQVKSLERTRLTEQEEASVRAEALKAELDQVTKARSALQDELAQATAALKENKNKDMHNDDSGQVEQLKADLVKVEEERDVLREQAEQNAAKVEQLQVELNKATKDNEKLREEAEQSRQECEIMESQVETLDAQAQYMRTDLEETQAAHKKLEAAHKDLEEQLALANKEKTSLESENLELKNKSEQFKQACTDLSKEVSNLTNDRQNLRAELETLRKEKKQLEINVQEVNLANKQLEERLEELNAKEIARSHESMNDAQAKGEASGRATRNIPDDRSNSDASTAEESQEDRSPQALNEEMMYLQVENQIVIDQNTALRKQLKALQEELASMSQNSNGYLTKSGKAQPAVSISSDMEPPASPPAPGKSPRSLLRRASSALIGITKVAADSSSSHGNSSDAPVPPNSPTTPTGNLTRASFRLYHSVKPTSSSRSSTSSDAAISRSSSGHRKAGYVMMADGLTITNSTRWVRQYLVTTERSFAIFPSKRVYESSTDSPEQWIIPVGFIAKMSATIDTSAPYAPMPTAQRNTDAAADDGHAIDDDELESKKGATSPRMYLLVGPERAVQKLMQSKRRQFDRRTPPFLFRSGEEEELVQWCDLINDAIAMSE